MRVTLSALAAVLVASLASTSDAFSPALSRVAKTSSSTAARKSDILHARRGDDESSDNKSGVVSSILLAGAALQLSTSKVSAPNRDVHRFFDVFPLSTCAYTILISTGISRRKRSGCSRIIAPQWSNLRGCKCCTNCFSQ